jgi:hypothetical protein
MEKIDRNDRVTLFAGDVKLLQMSIKGILGNLQIKASSKEPYRIKIKAKVQAGNNLPKTELFGNMTFQELLMTQSSIDHGRIPSELIDFDTHVCITNVCANLKGCSEELCNNYQIHSKGSSMYLQDNFSHQIYLTDLPIWLWFMVIFFY